MVGCAALANASARHSGYDPIVAYVDREDCVDYDAHLLKRLSLGDRTGEAVKNKSVRASVGLKIVTDDADYDLVGDKITVLDITLGSFAELCARCHSVAKDLSRRNRGDIFSCGNNFGLSAFSRTGGSHNDKIH